MLMCPACWHHIHFDKQHCVAGQTNQDMVIGKGHCYRCDELPDVLVSTWWQNKQRHDDLQETLPVGTL